MRAPKTIRLPRPKDLKSNKVEDIQNFLEVFFNELDKIYRLLWQDAATIQVDEDNWVYFGNKDVNGTWRMGGVGNNLEVQKRISGTWKRMGKWSE